MPKPSFTHNHSIESGKRRTRQTRQSRVNDALFFLHGHLAEPLDIQTLADKACYSLHHFQRVFKQVTGLAVHDYVRQARLEWAANILIFNSTMGVGEVAQECGFQSNSSFSHAFKDAFGVSPRTWRQADSPENQSLARTASAAFKMGDVRVEQLEDIRVAYIRQTGYDSTIKQPWQQLKRWAQQHPSIDFNESPMFGLHHSNPNRVPLNLCRYVACLGVGPDVFPNQGVSVMNIPGGEYACCSAQGQYGDLLVLWQYLYYDWLPQSPYESLSIPAHVWYRKNHLFKPEPGSEFDIEFRLPVRLRY